MSALWQIFLRLLAWLLPVKRPQLGPGDWPDTTGPEHPDAPQALSEVVKANWGETGAQAPTERPSPWMSGWYAHAKRVPAHPGRVGSVIVPRCVVVHTTDMHPSTHDALVSAWQKRPGAGNCAHFLIGRTPEQGIKQFVQITRNANHAGGSSGHGWYFQPDGRKLHPNSVAVGIELDAAGRVRWENNKWIHTDSGKEIPKDDVVVLHGKGWHVATLYQKQALFTLLADLADCLKPLPAGTRILSNGNYRDEGVPWGFDDSPELTGHVTLDPRRKTDPGPQVMGWLKELDK